MVGLSGQTFNHLKPKGNIIKTKKKEIRWRHGESKDNSTKFSRLKFQNYCKL